MMEMNEGFEGVVAKTNMPLGEKVAETSCGIS